MFIRRPLAGLFVLLTLIAALALQLVWFVGRDVLSSERFADAGVQAASTSAGRELITNAVVDAVGRDAPADALDPVRLRDTVRSATATAPFREAVRRALRNGHADFIDHPGDGIEIPTGALRASVVRAYSAVSPDAGALVPPAGRFPTVQVEVPQEVRATVSALRIVQSAIAALPLVLVVLFALAVIISKRRRGTVRLIGAGVVVLAVAPYLIRERLPSATADAAGPTGALARRFAEALTTDWALVSVGTLGVGVVLILVGMRRG